MQSPLVSSSTCRPVGKHRRRCGNQFTSCFPPLRNPSFRFIASCLHESKFAPGSAPTTAPEPLISEQIEEDKKSKGPIRDSSRSSNNLRSQSDAAIQSRDLPIGDLRVRRTIESLSLFREQIEMSCSNPTRASSDECLDPSAKLTPGSRAKHERVPREERGEERA